jgi:peptide chain release factor subunit 1
MGAVETLIVWENFDVTRYVLRNPQTQETKVLHLRSDQEKEKSHFQDKDTGVELEHVEEMPLLEWFANNYKNFGKNLFLDFRKKFQSYFFTFFLLLSI